MSTAVNTPVEKASDAENASELLKLQDLLLGSLVASLENKLSGLEDRLKAQSAAQFKSYEVLETKIGALEEAFLTNLNETEHRSKKEFHMYRKEQTETINHLKSNTSEAAESLKSRLDNLEKSIKKDLDKKVNQKE